MPRVSAKARPIDHKKRPIAYRVPTSTPRPHYAHGMAPTAGSRHSFTSGVRDELGRLFLTEREPYGFAQHADTRVHVVVHGDSLFELAGRYFAPLPRACGFWWAIADFQPEPIVDPTLVLQPSRQLFIPSLRVLTDVILSEQRRRFSA